MWGYLPLDCSVHYDQPQFIDSAIEGAYFGIKHATDDAYQENINLEYRNLDKIDPEYEESIYLNHRINSEVSSYQYGASSNGIQGMIYWKTRFFLFMNFNFEVNDENSTNVKDEWDRHDGNPLDKIYVNDISNETIFDEDG